ncbi:hypothetical protein GCM10009608_52460 [Pseudonocardia alaniniphila]
MPVAAERDVAARDAVAPGVAAPGGADPDVEAPGAVNAGGAGPAAAMGGAAAGRASAAVVVDRVNSPGPVPRPAGRPAPGVPRQAGVRPGVAGREQLQGW